MPSPLGVLNGVPVADHDSPTANLVHLAGSKGPLVLFLHANGFPVECYRPLARILAQKEIQCFGIELCGQDATLASPGSISDAYLAALLSLMTKSNKIGCYAFAHSGGARLAIQAEACCPGTFAAIYAFDPVFFLPRQPGSNARSPGQIFESMAASASRRKIRFASKQEAAARFNRPPYSSFHPECFLEYVQHGLVDNSDGSCKLVTSPEVEARWYLEAGNAEAMSMLLDKVPLIQCPVMVAMGSKVHGEMFHFLVPEGIKQAKRFPKGRAERFEGLGHLGPLEDPEGVALKALHCFKASCKESIWAAVPACNTIDAQSLSSRL